MFWEKDDVPQWKKNIAEEYIQNNILNKDLLEIQNSLNGLKEVVSSKKEKQEENVFWLESTLNILFNWRWKQRTKLWYEANKLKTISYYMMSEQSKNNLDILYNELERATSEEELKKWLWIELLQLKQEIIWEEEQINENEKNNDNKEANIKNLKKTEQYIYKQAELYWVTDKRQIAYILATVNWECGFVNQSEKWWSEKSYWKDWYYGRGFVQLTHKWNYKKFTKIINDSWLKFKDNSWNLLSTEKLDLVKNPDVIEQSDDLAAFILVYWMKNGSFTGKKLDDFIKPNKTDFYNSRSIINWMSSSPDKYENRAKEYLEKIETQKINDNILVGPTILANLPKEFWWLWNSIMTGFQWYKNKSNFENMDGVEWKSTKTHPNRFNSKKDVKKRKKSHPWVKSFVMYFGANTTDNKQTLEDLEQRSIWLKTEDIQPVLCTCIWANNNPHLSNLNPKILELWKSLDVPVLDFASKYEENPNLFAMWENKHPDWKGYDFMKDQILEA